MYYFIWREPRFIFSLMGILAMPPKYIAFLNQSVTKTKYVCIWQVNLKMDSHIVIIPFISGVAYYKILPFWHYLTPIRSPFNLSWNPQLLKYSLKPISIVTKTMNNFLLLSIIIADIYFMIDLPLPLYGLAAVSSTDLCKILGKKYTICTRGPEHLGKGTSTLTWTAEMRVRKTCQDNNPRSTGRQGINWH